MRRVLQVVLGIVAIVSGIMLYNVLRDAQWAHSWLKSTLVMLPELGTIIAVFELHHSAKANELRNQRNELAKANNDLEGVRNALAEENNTLSAVNNKLTEEYNELQRQLQTERNEHLAEIARQMQRPQTVSERNAAKLRQHLGSPVVVFNDDNGRWPGTPRIAEVFEGNIAALFQPTQQGSQAYVVYADCKDLEVIEIPSGSCPLQVKVNKRYGNFIQLERSRGGKTERHLPPCQRLSAVALRTTHNLGSQGLPKRERCQSTRLKMEPIRFSSKARPASPSSETTKLSRFDSFRSKSSTSPRDSSAAQREPVRAATRYSSASSPSFMGGESAGAEFDTVHQSVSRFVCLAQKTS